MYNKKKHISHKENKKKKLTLTPVVDPTWDQRRPEKLPQMNRGRPAGGNHFVHKGCLAVTMFSPSQFNQAYVTCSFLSLP